MSPGVPCGCSYVWNGYCWLPPLAAEKLASRKPLSLAEEWRLAVSTTGQISHLVSLSYERTFRNFRKGTTFNNKATEATSSFLFYACWDALNVLCGRNLCLSLSSKVCIHLHSSGTLNRHIPRLDSGNNIWLRQKRSPLFRPEFLYRPPSIPYVSLQ